MISIYFLTPKVGIPVSYENSGWPEPELKRRIPLPETGERHMENQVPVIRSGIAMPKFR